MSTLEICIGGEPPAQEHITQFQNGNPGARANIIEKDAGKKIQKWFYNHYLYPQCQYTKFTCKWSSHSAFYQLNRDEVLELARETSGMDLGAPGFLDTFQDATTQDYAQAAKEWSQDTPPTHVQSSIILVQVDHLGLSEAAVQDMWDDIESVLDDGISFLKFCPDWKTALLWEQWSQFGINCFSQGFITGKKNQVIPWGALPLESNEEVFVLSHSNEIDEEDEADPGNTGAVEEPLPVVVDAFQVGSDMAETLGRSLTRERNGGCASAGVHRATMCEKNSNTSELGAQYGFICN
ncbi:hypothetical protein EI94DRAFT_1699846 [Lactarius quietus]|nr:hypothetical protein EI94DRAFT_1699846 [Lactarius quietus]